jgi:hypothetical protein
MRGSWALSNRQAVQSRRRIAIKPLYPATYATPRELVPHVSGECSLIQVTRQLGLRSGAIRSSGTYCCGMPGAGGIRSRIFSISLLTCPRERHQRLSSTAPAINAVTHTTTNTVNTRLEEILVLSKVAKNDKSTDRKERSKFRNSPEGDPSLSIRSSSSLTTYRFNSPNGAIRITGRGAAAPVRIAIRPTLRCLGQTKHSDGGSHGTGIAA